MNFKKILILSFLVTGLFIANKTTAQCDTIASICGKHITPEYISDGQQYRCLLLDNETAEFHATLYGGTRYRIAGCTGLSDGNLIFRIYDNERNELFSNSEYKNAPYWDFDITSTLDCIIEAQLDPIATSSGCAVLLIGFAQ